MNTNEIYHHPSAIKSILWRFLAEHQICPSGGNIDKAYQICKQECKLVKRKVGNKQINHFEEKDLQKVMKSLLHRLPASPCNTCKSYNDCKSIYKEVMT